jgi:hypothetical protein
VRGIDQPHRRQACGNQLKKLTDGRIAAECFALIGPVNSREAIAESLPPQLKWAADRYGTEDVIAAGFEILGYPASWATCPDEFNPILDYLEQKHGH